VSVSLLIFTLQELVVILFVIVVWRFTLEAAKCQSVFVENACGLKIVDEFVIFLEGTCDLFPCDKFGDLFRKLPELLEIDVTVGKSEE
jgi:hypothetical protein